MQNPFRKLSLVAIASVALAAGLALAESPVRSGSSLKHPNMAAAQKYCGDAMNKIAAAQNANEWDQAGHAQKAKDLLEQANSEFKLADEASKAEAARK
jgi:predicted metal-dependent phosphoesterase TrpH